MLFILPILLSSFETLNKSVLPVKWVISSGCTLKVDGSTNVNKFSCSIINYGSSDTIVFYKTALQGPTRLTGNLKLAVQEFDCHNPMMTKDLRKTLKAEKFPVMSIRFIDLSKYPSADDQSTLIKGNVLISLAGVTKKFEINYRVIPEGVKSMSLLGKQHINFSDFNIIPPRKIGGMIQTNDELSVQFHLKMKSIN